eukprot:2370310-Rhodomonas_salina.2
MAAACALSGTDLTYGDACPRMVIPGDGRVEPTLYGTPPIVLRPCYVLSGTDIRKLLSPLSLVLTMRCGTAIGSSIVLCVPYALSGTDVGHAATRYGHPTEVGHQTPGCTATPDTPQVGIVLRVRSALPGTDIAYSAIILRYRYASPGTDRGYAANVFLVTEQVEEPNVSLARLYRSPLVWPVISAAAYAHGMRCPVLTIAYGATAARENRCFHVVSVLGLEGAIRPST